MVTSRRRLPAHPTGAADADACLAFGSGGRLLQVKRPTHIAFRVKERGHGTRRASGRSRRPSVRRLGEALLALLRAAFTAPPGDGFVGRSRPNTPAALETPDLSAAQPSLRHCRHPGGSGTKTTSRRGFGRAREEKQSGSCKLPLCATLITSRAGVSVWTQHLCLGRSGGKIAPALFSSHRAAVTPYLPRVIPIRT